MKLSLSALLLFSLLLCSSLVDIANAYSSPPTSPPIQSPPGVPSFCPKKCEWRCSRNYMHEMCIKMCMICCGKCKCVPSGPFADKSQCPCYRDMTNKKGKPKCP